MRWVVALEGPDVDGGGLSEGRSSTEVASQRRQGRLGREAACRCGYVAERSDKIGSVERSGCSEMRRRQTRADRFWRVGAQGPDANGMGRQWTWERADWYRMGMSVLVWEDAGEMGLDRQLGSEKARLVTYKYIRLSHFVVQPFFWNRLEHDRAIAHCLALCVEPRWAALVLPNPLQQRARAAPSSPAHHWCSSCRSTSNRCGRSPQGPK